MSLRARFIAYLGALHVVLVALAWHVARGRPAWVLGAEAVVLASFFLGVARGRPAWVLGAEAVVLASFFLGVALVGRLVSALQFVHDVPQFLQDGDLTTRFRETGQRETDRLIRVYNQMIDSLREERTRLQEREFFLGRILEASPSGVITLGFDDRIDYVNPAARRLLSLADGEVAGRTLAEVGAALGPALSRLAPGEAQVFPAWGGRRVRGLRGTFMDRGFPRAFLLVEELTDELRQFERAAYARIIRLMSHEVNNTVGASNSLLHSVLVYGAQLDPSSRADFTHAIEVVIGRTERLNDFMRSYADVLRLPRPARQPHDVLSILRGIESLMRPLLVQRRVEWRWAVDEPLPPIVLDRAQVEQALVNICKNAIEAAGERGWIAVRTGRRGSRAYLVVEDSGAGLSDEVRANLFTPFFSTKEGGQGLGLTLVQEILTQHGFDYSLDAPPGGPTQFTIVFGHEASPRD